MGMKEDKKLRAENARSALTQSNIAPSMWTLKLPDMGKNGVNLREYLQSDMFMQDKRDGMGYCISGTGIYRIELFQTMCKELPLMWDNLYLITLRKLATALVYNDADFLYKLDRVAALSISYFYDSSIPEIPYTNQERLLVEDYLREKLFANQRLYISSSNPIKHMHWWSDDFRCELIKKCRELELGKNNRG